MAARCTTKCDFLASGHGGDEDESDNGGRFQYLSDGDEPRGGERVCEREVREAVGVQYSEWQCCVGSQCWRDGDWEVSVR